MSSAVEIDDISVDEALFYAIANDYDLSSASGISELKTALESLREGAVVEQELELLPETGPTDGDSRKVHRNTGNDDLRYDTSSSKPSEANFRSTTDEDGVDSIATGVSALMYAQDDDESSHYSTGYGEAGEALESLSKDRKVEYLQDMFPSVAHETIRDVLTKCGNKFDLCTDELLNLAFLRDTGDEKIPPAISVPKGIDAFLGDANETKGNRKSRRKKKRNQGETDSPWMSDSATSSGVHTPSSVPTNIWSTASHDIDFIASRTYLPLKAIASVYHANNAQLGPTIRALAMREGAAYNQAPEKIEDLMRWQTEELKADFERVPFSLVYGVILLAKRILPAAKELLDAMTAINEKAVMLGKVSGLASYTPIDLSEDEDVGPVSFRNSTAIPVGSGIYTTSHLTNAHGAAATQAFQQASAAYKRGKSDHLMGGAAVYYASVGHERVKAAKMMQASAADTHVARQSSSSTLDLHGVNVADAVRIARQNTEAWWEGLLDRKYVVGGIGNGYRIVTGVGRHSSDGIGRIGPAVSKMLVREGWKVQINSGELVVLGKSRKK